MKEGSSERERETGEGGKEAAKEGGNKGQSGAVRERGRQGREAVQEGGR